MIAFALTLLCCLIAPGEVSIDKDTISLGDLIDFPDGDLRAGVLLGQAPNPGLARRIHAYEIEAKLRVSGLRTEDLKLPASVLIRRQSKPLAIDQVRAFVRDLFERHFPEARIEIQELIVPTVEVATGNVQISASLPANFNPGGQIPVRLDIRADGFSRLVYAQARVRIETPQPMLLNPIRAHSPVLEGDVEWKFALLARSQDTIQSLDQLRGKFAKEDLDSGEVLTRPQLYSPVLVRRGDAVTVVAAMGNIRISAMMKARSGGEYGQTIIVEHLNGSGQATARVTGQGMVEALVGGR